MHNKGHLQLIDHVETLLDDVKTNEFHDFESRVAMPKVYLVQRLQTLIDNAKSGMYDN